MKAAIKMFCFTEGMALDSYSWKNKRIEMASYCDFHFISRKHSKIHSIRSLTAQPSEQHTEVPKQVSDVDETLDRVF